MISRNNCFFLLVAVFILLYVMCSYTSKDGSKHYEKFKALESTAFGWNVDTSFHPPNSGYSFYGIWPKYNYDKPWRRWNYGRMPDYLIDSYTAQPQIDYNYKNKFSLDFTIVNGKVAVNGMPNKTLQLDRNKPYFIRIFTPGKKIMLSKDGVHPSYFQPTDQASTSVLFDLYSPNKIYYLDANNPSDRGVIYLNTIRADNVYLAQS